jgi:hypothetical protein
MLVYSVKCMLCMMGNFIEHVLNTCNASGTVCFAKVERCTGCVCLCVRFSRVTFFIISGTINPVQSQSVISSSKCWQLRSLTRVIDV